MKLSCAVAVLAVLLSGSVPTGNLDPLPDIGAVVATPEQSVNSEKKAKALRNTLVSGLRAVRDDQKRFIDHIVEMVAEKKLPQSVVYAAFRWSRKQRPDYPFPYFKYSVRELAKRKGINI